MFYLQSSKHYICIVFQDKKKKKRFGNKLFQGLIIRLPVQLPRYESNHQPIVEYEKIINDKQT